MTTTNAIVRNALAHYLDLDPSTIRPWQHLEADLYLSPRDLALVVHAMEELEDVTLAADHLRATATVGDLQALLSRAIAHQRPSGRVERVA